MKADGGGPDPSHGCRSDSGVVFGRPIIVLSPSADVPGDKQDKIVATSDIDAESGAEFFDSYLDTLTGGFVDFVVDYPESISRIHDVSEGRCARLRAVNPP